MAASHPSEATGSALRAGRIALGLLAFVALAGLGALTAGWLDGGAATIVDAARAMPAALGAGVALLALDFLLGGLRLHLWIRTLAPGTRYAVSLQTYLVNLFAAAISPMGAASGPAQLATLVRGGVRPARALAALFLMYMAILGALLLFGGAGAIYLLLTTDLASRLGGPERALLVGSVAAAALLLIALLNPRGGDVLAAGLARLGRRLGGRPGSMLQRLSARLRRGVGDYRAALAAARANWKAPLAGSFGVSVAMLLNKCSIAFLVAAGLGSSSGYFHVAARHALQTLFLYFSPSPGQSGLAEASVSAFMAGVIPDGRWLEYALLWRAVSSYVGVAVGAVAVLYLFGRRRVRGRAHPAAGAGADESAYIPTLAAARTARAERP